jgi:hypothetical protein
MVDLAKLKANLEHTGSRLSNFDPETQQELKKKIRRPTILSKIENGVTIWYELESGKPIEA